MIKAANVEVEPYWPGLFAKALETTNVKDLITNIGSAVGAAPAGGVAGMNDFIFVSFMSSLKAFSFVKMQLIDFLFQPLLQQLKSRKKRKKTRRKKKVKRKMTTWASVSYLFLLFIIS